MNSSDPFISPKPKDGIHKERGTKANNHGEKPLTWLANSSAARDAIGAVQPISIDAGSTESRCVRAILARRGTTQTLMKWIWGFEEDRKNL